MTLEARLELRGEIQFVSRLDEIHERLLAHFSGMRAERDVHGEGKPLFALEHGLDRDEVTDLQDVVQEAILSIGLSTSAWLPYIVYAAEVGYSYTGEEYWQTFERTTPGWYGDNYRQWLRRRFRTFADQFGGARPTGVWAGQFAIIAWPITHAVLPMDLQLQLAELLYDYRYSLTRSLLSDPDELGAKLAARAWRGSSRFQVFAQNEGLLGQVSSALLLGEGESSPMLASSTLQRIVSDLSVEHHARRWLRDAVRTAARIRVHGVIATPHERRHSESADVGRSIRPPELLLVRAGDNTWSLWVELPDLTLGLASLDHLTDSLSTRRCIVAGTDGAPFAPRRVLFPAQRVKLTEWPGWDDPLLRLEGGDPRDNDELGQLVRLPSGPLAVFEIVEGFGRELRGRQIRPGGRYAIMMTTDIDEPGPTWLAPATITVGGLRAFIITVPAVVDQADEIFLRNIALSIASDVKVGPVGLTPAAWRNDGSFEYVIGDSPVLGISSTRRLASCVIAVDDGVPIGIPASAESHDPILFSLGALEHGVHEVSLLLLPSGEEGAPIEEVVRVLIREREVRASSGSYREALFIIAHPERPSLDEVWAGRATLEILAPADLAMRVSLTLEGPEGRSLIRKSLQGLSSPVSPSAWERAFNNQMRSVDAVSTKFDEAISCALEVSHQDLGSVSLTFDRGFVPLRWAIGRDRGTSYARLFNNLGEQVRVQRLDFARPDEAIQVDLPEREVVLADAGGLFIAEASDFQAAVILPPLVRTIEDLQRVRVTPILRDLPLNVGGVTSRIVNAKLWADATLPGNPLAQVLRSDVMRAIHARLCSDIGGDRWAGAEAIVRTSDAAEAIRSLGVALGQHQQQRDLAAPLTELAREMLSLALDARVSLFQAFLNERSWVFGRRCDAEVAEAFLRLASAPESLLATHAELLGQVVADVLETPLLVRASRFVVHASDLMFSEGPGSGLYGGWDWW